MHLLSPSHFIAFRIISWNRNTIARNNFFWLFLETIDEGGYEVRQKPKSEAKVLDDIAEFIQATYPSQSGIIYCLSRYSISPYREEIRSDLCAENFQKGGGTGRGRVDRE